MNNKLVVGIVVLLVGVGAGWYFLKGNYSSPSPKTEPVVTKGAEAPVIGLTGTPQEGSGQPGQTGADKGGVISASSVVYGTGGFVPKTVTVKKGTSVRWVNQSNGSMWVASGIHPTHQLLPGFDQLKSVGTGGTYDYTFVKVGTWQYHNHLVPTDLGYVVVTE